jgi:hypothetical protein
VVLLGTLGLAGLGAVSAGIWCLRSAGEPAAATAASVPETSPRAPVVIQQMPMPEAPPKLALVASPEVAAPAPPLRETPVPVARRSNAIARRSAPRLSEHRRTPPRRGDSVAVSAPVTLSAAPVVRAPAAPRSVEAPGPAALVDSGNPLDGRK